MSVQVLSRPVRTIKSTGDFAKIYTFVCMLAVLVACSLFICGLFVSGQLEIAGITDVVKRFTLAKAVAPVAESLVEINTEASMPLEQSAHNSDHSAVLNQRINALIAGYVPDSAENLSGKIFLISDKYGISPAVLTALIGLESGFNNLKSDSGKLGLLQISESEASILAGELKIPFIKAALYNPAYNLEIAAYKLSRLKEMTAGDIEKALVAFKAGKFNSQGFALDGEVDPALMGYKDNVMKLASELSAA